MSEMQTDPGDMVDIPPEVKHWPGASNEWLELVDDGACGRL